MEKCHVEDLNRGWYGMIIGMDILNTMVIDLTFCTNTIEYVPGPYKGCTTPMIDLNDYDFEPMNEKMLPYLEVSFINSYVNECF